MRLHCLRKNNKKKLKYCLLKSCVKSVHLHSLPLEPASFVHSVCILNREKNQPCPSNYIWNYIYVLPSYKNSGGVEEHAVVREGQINRLKKRCCSIWDSCCKYTADHPATKD